ncbi:hypothetical protein DPMN_178427 [Dreissena polymorpha]|uniref:Uncharacterized protein n=1 Tax=Dreissena polymorpha TaxID=45954 RepID=A0A9D4EC63_DREPO|nr:hypothetical protein DPMN_178427 [Dreissena polymorpha]
MYTACCIHAVYFFTEYTACTLEDTSTQQVCDTLIETSSSTPHIHTRDLYKSLPADEYT